MVIAKKIDAKKLERTGAATEEQTKKNKEKKKRDLEELLAQLIPHAASLLGIKESELPTTKTPDYKTTNILGATLGRTMKVDVLTSKGSAGSEPSVSSSVWKVLAQRRQGGRSYYVRGHLLNHNLHGPGDTWKNLTVLSQEGNRKHLVAAERPVKIAVSSGGIVNYEVRADYQRSRTAEATDQQLEGAGIDPSQWGTIREIKKYEKEAVPEQLTVKSDLLEPDGKGGFKKKKNLVPNQEVPNPVDTALGTYKVGEGKALENVSLTGDSAEKIAKNTNNIVDDIITIQSAAKTAASEGSLDRYDQIISKMEELGVRGLPYFIRIIRGHGKQKGLQGMRNVRLN